MALSTGIKNLLWNFKNSRRAKLTVLIVLVLGVVSAAGYVLFGGGGSATTKSTDSVAPRDVAEEEQTVRRALDGVLVPIRRANFYPVAISVENLVASRPHAGLDEAGLVYETLVEGGITRFLAVYASGEDVKKIGPIRSARPVHVDLTRELNAMFVHSGGSPAALDAIRTTGINDFNQFFNGQYFWRDADRAKNKAAEHTLYSSSELLARALRDTDAPLVGTFTPWRFTDDAPRAERPTEPKTITIDFSSFNYKVEYRYDPGKNVYLRFMAEQPHAMEDGTQIAAANVVVHYAPTTLADNAGRLDIDLIGEGPAVVFRNGSATDATWKKGSPGERTRYYDATGAEIEFIAGPTWVEIVPADREVSYT